MNTNTATIDNVIQQLDDIIDWCRSHKSRLGYFAALYRKVTLKVKNGITDGYFGDGQRMERLDVIFAGRYLEAFEQYRSNQPTTRSWRLTFGLDCWNNMFYCRFKRYLSCDFKRDHHHFGTRPIVLLQL
jgi:hypothetical protein